MTTRRQDHQLPAAGTRRRAFPTDIVAGPDGALWFTEARGDKIGRITTTGDVTEYPIPTAGAFAADITVGPDGALWFTESSGNKIGRITTKGELTEYPLDAPDALPGRDRHRPRRLALLRRGQHQRRHPHERQGRRSRGARCCRPSTPSR